MQRRTKQKILIALTATAGVLMIAYAGYNFNKHFGTRTYKDENGSFSIKFQKNWAYAVNKDGVNVIFYAPFESDLDRFTENVNIVVNDISKKPMSLIEYTKLALEQMDIIFKGQMKIVESEPYRLGDEQGFKYTIEGAGESPIKIMMVWALRGSDIYQLTYSAHEASFDHYLGTVEKMITSFRVTR